MSSKSGCRLSLIVFGLTVCLTIPACRTCKEREGVADEVSASSDAVQDTIRKLHEIIIPEMTFFPPATIIDAVDFFKQACRVNDKSGTTPEQSGISFTVSLPQVPLAGGDSQPADPFAAGAVTNSMPKIPAVSVRNINLNDAIKIVCEVTGMRMYIRGDGEVVLASKRLSFDEDFVTRSYNVPPRLADCLFSGRAGKASEADPNKVWQAFFEELGVTGPDFARVVCLPTIGKLLVTNTAENLNVIEAVFDQFSLDLVEVDMQIHAFRTQDIERLQLAGGVTVETLTELRRKGRSKPVAASTALTKSGQEAVVKAVQEAVCPTELNVGAEQSGSNVTSRGAANALTPGNFEMRETGMTLQVVPEIAQNGAIINLMLNPQWVTLEGWESYSAALASGRTHKTLAFRQPVFGVTSFQTQVSLKDGATVLLGSSSTPDGKWVHVGFLTARLQDVQPRSSGRRFDTATGRATRTQNAEGVCKTKPQSEEQRPSVAKKMRDVVIPELDFRPPATIIDAVRFFREVSFKYDKSEVPEAQRGINLVLKLPETSEVGGLPAISALRARFINLYDALKLVCDVTGMKFRVKDGIVWIVPKVEPEEELITWVYPVLTSMSERMSNANSSHVGDDNRQDWKTFFAQLGVNWPEGASVSYLDSIGLLRVTNTPENLDVFGQVIKDLSIYPCLIEEEVQIHAFPPEDIERLRLSDGLSVESLTDLRKKGKSKPVASASVLTKSGQEATAKAVREILYPTALLPCGVPTGSNGISRNAVSAFIPGNFEMREVGMILQVLPEIAASDHSQINVMFNPQWVTLDRWETYPAALASGRTHKTLAFRQPVFGVTSFQTQVSLKDGATVLLGSSSTPDGKWVHVGFLTVKRMDVRAGPLGCK